MPKDLVRRLEAYLTNIGMSLSAALSQINLWTDFILASEVRVGVNFVKEINLQSTWEIYLQSKYKSKYWDWEDALVKFFLNWQFPFTFTSNAHYYGIFINSIFLNQFGCWAPFQLTDVLWQKSVRRIKICSNIQELLHNLYEDCQEVTGYSTATFFLVQK